MATGATELPIPLNEGVRETIIAPERLFQPGEEAYRDKLEAPVFTGLGDVEQFIQTFNEVRAITQCSPRVVLIKLHTEGANGTSQAVRTDIQYKRGLRCAAELFWHLRYRRTSRLQRLLRKENTPLQDNATIVKRLARIAYSDLPETQQQHYILDDFNNHSTI